MNFLGIIEPYVEELVLRQVKYGKRSVGKISETNFSFPKLKRLTIISCCTFMYTEGFKKVATLTNLIVGTDGLSAIRNESYEFNERIKAIQKLMMNNFGEFLKLICGIRKIFFISL